MTLAKRVVPCLHVERGSENTANVYTSLDAPDEHCVGDPIEMAKAYNEAGADELIVLDTNATTQARETMLDTVAQIADEMFIPMTVGGGVRTPADIKAALRVGADKVSSNTAALRNPALVDRAASSFGSQCVVIGIDARRRYDEAGEHYGVVDGESCWFECLINGRSDATGRDVVEWAAEATERGAGELFINSVDAEGSREGFDIPLIDVVCDSVTTPVMAASGCGGPEDAHEMLTETDADAAVAASIFHSGEYTIQEVKAYLDWYGVDVRI
jgi:cyclase